MIREGLLDHLDTIYELLSTVVPAADLVLTHNAIVPAHWVAEVRRVPCVTLHVVPT